MRPSYDELLKVAGFSLLRIVLQQGVMTMCIGMCISTAAIFAACGSVRAQNVSVPTSSTNQVTPSSSITATSARPSPTPSTQPIVPTSQPSAAAVGGESSTGQLGKVVVTSDLDQSREQIAPSLGAVTYSLGPTEIKTVPQGENANFQQILLRRRASSRIPSARNTSAASTRT